MTNHNSKTYTLILRDIERALPLKDLLVRNNINVIIEPIYKIAPIKFKPINFKEYQALLITSLAKVSPDLALVLTQLKPCSKAYFSVIFPTQ